MDLIRLDDRGSLFISPDIDDWQALEQLGISAIIDLDGAVDIGVPLVPNHIIYLYFPFNDAELPDVGKLHAVAQFAATLANTGHKVLCHCSLGFNRSALVAGLVLKHMGMTGQEALELLRRQRPGALYNEAYAAYLLSLEDPPTALQSPRNSISHNSDGT